MATTGATNAATTQASEGAAPDTTGGGTGSAAATGTIRGRTGLCLDLPGALAVSGNYVQVVGCNGTPAQSWTLASDGTVRVLGLCAVPASDSSVHVATCDGRDSAQWHVSGTTLVNDASGRCLADPSSGRFPGTPVTTSRCTGASGQQWSLP